MRVPMLSFYADVGDVNCYCKINWAAVIVLVCSKVSYTWSIQIVIGWAYQYYVKVSISLLFLLMELLILLLSGETNREERFSSYVQKSD